jgi:hypothetical protein
MGVGVDVPAMSSMEVEVGEMISLGADTGVVVPVRSSVGVEVGEIISLNADVGVDVQIRSAADVPPGVGSGSWIDAVGEDAMLPLGSHANKNTAITTHSNKKRLLEDELFFFIKSPQLIPACE